MSAGTRFGDVLASARASERAVGAFTCYDQAGFEAVARAAEARSAPVIVLVSPGSFRTRGGERLVAAFLRMAEISSADMLVQLDHVSDPELIERAAGSGLDAVMVDGSKLPYDDNLALSAGWVRALRPRGIGVEAELGRVEGHEDEARETLHGAMTEPDEARAFREASEVDCLALAIGNVHGHYSGVPALDWPRLERIAELELAPLSLHGASGLPEQDLRRAVQGGVAKVNVNTELRAAYFGALESDLQGRAEALDLLGLGEGATAAVQEVVESKLAAFGWTA